MFTFTTALVEFAATTAALNARALARAGLLEAFEGESMHALLDIVERMAASNQNDEETSLVSALRACLPHHGE